MNYEPESTAALVERNTVTPIPFKAHKVKWLSAELLETIFENHYGARVRELNALEQQHAALVRSISTPAKKNALEKELLTTANLVNLHETYFNSIADESEQPREFNPTNHLAKSIELAYGSVEKLLSQFLALSQTNNNATQWMLLVWSAHIGQLVFVQVGEQAVPVAGVTPIIALNLQPYAFEMDFDQDKEAYVRAFLRCLHWGRISDRFKIARQLRKPTQLKSTSESITVSELKQLSEQTTNSPLVIDVRHTDDCERYRHRIKETEWRDSYAVNSWSSELPRDRPIVVYCMYGFWVSQDVATELRDQGYDARTLIGGINSWRAMGYEASAI